MACEGPLPSAPPLYSDVFPENSNQELPAIIAEQQTEPLMPHAHPLPPQRENNFTMIRFIFFWTGLTSECSAVTCRLCSLWYVLLGVYGVTNVILPYCLLWRVLPDWPNSFLILYMLAGVSCVLLSIMWFCSIKFFYKHHPRKQLYDSHNYRLPQGTNSGYLVCWFVFSCALFGAVSLVLIHDIVAVCALFDPPVRCVLPYYVMSITASMCIITFVFICFNSVCYFHFIKRNAGSLC